MTIALAGVDGCRAGWVCACGRLGTDGALEVSACIVMPKLESLLGHMSPGSIIAVDIPIELHDEPRAGGRSADREARRLLKRRGSSVFSAPPRFVLDCASYAMALEACRSRGDATGISRQCWGIVPKIREVDVLCTRLAAQEGSPTIIEVHPELCFAAMMGDETGPRPAEHPKRTAAGAAERLAALRRYGIEIPAEAASFRKSQSALDDIIDAHAALWSAGRIARGIAVRIPREGAELGAIWY